MIIYNKCGLGLKEIRMKEKWTFRQNNKLKKQVAAGGKCTNDGYLYYAYNYTSQRVMHGEIIKLNTETLESAVIYSDEFELGRIILNEDGLIFSNGYGLINCIDFEGNLIWRCDTLTERMPRAIHVDDEFMVYLVGQMLVVERKTGNIVWKSEDVIGVGHVACERSGKYIYHNGFNQKITRYELSTGKVTWEYGQYLNIFKIICKDDNKLLLIHSYGKLEIVDIEKNKRVVLKNIMKGRIVTVPFVEDNVISFAYRYTETPPKDYKNKVEDIIRWMFTSVRYKENGDVESLYSVELAAEASTPSIITDDNYFYLGTEDRFFYQIDKNTGEIKDKIELSANCSFIEKKDENIILMLDDGKIVCYEP